MDKCDTCTIRYVCEDQHEFNCMNNNYKYYNPESKTADSGFTLTNNGSGYQPKTDCEKPNPPKSGSNAHKETNINFYEKEIDRLWALLEEEKAKNNIDKIRSIIDSTISDYNKYADENIKYKSTRDYFKQIIDDFAKTLLLRISASNPELINVVRNYKEPD